MFQGFEDCRLLDELMLKYEDISVVLKEFSAVRNRDAEAICDLAMYNYLEVKPQSILTSDISGSYMGKLLKSKIFVQKFNSGNT
jgi:hypothetical protein